MNGDELKYLRELIDQRWNDHAERARELKEWLQINFKDIFFKLDGLNCKGHKEKLRSLTWKVHFLYTCIFIGILISVAVRIFTQ